MNIGNPLMHPLFDEYERDIYRIQKKIYAAAGLTAIVFSDLEIRGQHGDKRAIDYYNDLIQININDMEAQGYVKPADMSLDDYNTCFEIALKMSKGVLKEIAEEHGQVEAEAQAEANIIMDGGKRKKRRGTKKSKKSRKSKKSKKSKKTRKSRK
jgi:hypothetical protein